MSARRLVPIVSRSSSRCGCFLRNGLAIVVVALVSSLVGASSARTWARLVDGPSAERGHDELLPADSIGLESCRSLEERVFITLSTARDGSGGPDALGFSP